MTKSITLTTTVTDPRSLPLLLDMTDVLHRNGFLDSLRVVDATGSREGAIALRGVIPIDGPTGSRVVTVDVAHLKSSGKKFTFSPGESGYRHKKTGTVLTPGGDGLSVVGRGRTGFIVGFVFDGRPSPAVELVCNGSSVFFRQGRGGGAVLATAEDGGGTGDGVIWRGSRIDALDNETLRVVLDTGVSVTCPVPQFSRVEITVSPPPSGVVDLVTSELPLHELSAGVTGGDRSYVSYFSSPPPAAEGKEVFSGYDVVYIDPTGWKEFVTGDGWPVFLGDPAYLGPLRRMGVVKGSDSLRDVHQAFLSRSAGVTRRFEVARHGGVELRRDESSVPPVSYSRDRDEGVPSLVCVLDPELVKTDLLERYRALVEHGPTGEGVDERASDVLVYLDSIVAGNPGQVDSFFHEIAEVLPRDLRERLISVLSR